MHRVAVPEVPLTDSRVSPLSRRRLLRNSVAGGAALGLGLRAPAVLAQTTAPIRIGVLNTFTGAQAYPGEDNLNGMKLYFGQIGWKIAGRPVELVVEDDQFSPQIGLQKVRKFVEGDHVDVITGPQGSSIALAILNYVKQRQAFLVVSGAGVDQITWERYPYLFRTTLTTWQMCQPMGAWAYDAGIRKIAISGTDLVAGHDTIREFKSSFVPKGGQVVLEVYPPAGTTDFSVYLDQIRASGADGSYHFYTGIDSSRFVQQYDQAGLKDKIRLTGFSSLTDDTAMAADGPAALGVVTSQIYVQTLDNPENREFIKDMKAKFNRTPTSYTDYGYVTARVIDETIKATGGDTDKDKMSAAMEKVAFNAPRGPFRFDPVVHHPIQNVYMCEVRKSGDGYVNDVFATIKDVRDPGRKMT
jgi:branched-chain amino acid transport system substrate-binding protein